MISDLKPIDIHSHFNHGSPYDTVKEGREETYHCNFEFLMEEYDNIGIEWGAFSSFASVLSDKDIIAENVYTYRLSVEHKRVYQWVVIDPRQEDTFLQADKILKSDKCLGIKIHPECHQYAINDYADKIFSYANEKETTVLMHPQSMDTIAGFVNKYPKMKLILAHLGGKVHVDAVEAAIHHNIYVDTSGGASFSNNVIEYAVGRIGSEKILFGTDTYSCAAQYGRILYARMKDRDKENILRNNALRLFS